MESIDASSAVLALRYCKNLCVGTGITATVKEGVNEPRETSDTNDFRRLSFWNIAL